MFTLIDEFYKVANSRGLDYKTEYQDNNTKLYVYLAGTKKKDITVKFENNILTVSASGKKGQAEWIGEQSWHLPRNSDVDKITSSYEDGVLEINLPSKKESNIRNIVVA